MSHITPKHISRRRGKRLSMPHTVLAPLRAGESAILWLLCGVSYYLEKDCTMEDAVDYALDDCLVTSRLRTLIFSRRDSLKYAVIRAFTPVPSRAETSH